MLELTLLLVTLDYCLDLYINTYLDSLNYLDQQYQLCEKACFYSCQPQD